MEGQATGDAAILDTLREWLKHGPAVATVLNLEWEETGLQHFDGFSYLLLKGAGVNRPRS